MTYSRKKQNDLNTSIEIVMVTALPCEARSLIDHFRLKKVQEARAFPLYRNAELALTLVVSGVGIIHVAAATAFAASYFSVRPFGFLNLGIAGAFDIPVGALRLVNKVSNEAGKALYPMALSHFQMMSAPLVTLSQPALASEDHLVDMEAFGFYQTAVRFTTLELIHSLKVISDNHDQDITHINPNQVKAWIEIHLEAIELFLARLRALAMVGHHQDRRRDCLLEALCEQFHLTQYHRYQVQGLIQKMIAFGLEADLMDLAKECRSIQQWLEQVQNRIHVYSLGVF